MMIISLQMYLQQVEIRNTERVVYGGESRLDVFLRWLGGTPGPTRLPFRYSVHGSPLNNNFAFLSCVQNVLHWSSIFLLCITQHSICLFIQPGKWLTNNFLQMLQFCEKIGWLVVVVGFTSPFIHFFQRQFHGVRFYAPPRRLPRILEATVDTIITIIVAKDQQIVFDKNTFSSNGNIIWLLSEGAAQLQRIKIV